LELSLIASYCDYSDIVCEVEKFVLSLIVQMILMLGVFIGEMKLISLSTGLDRPSELQEVEAPRFADNQLVKLSVTSNGRLYPPLLISVRG